jgi:PST family polysaccharide transporter
MASMINMRMDQVMLGSMVNNTVVGNYSAAVRLAEVWLIIPGIIGASIYPAIIAAKGKSEELYRQRILQTTKLMAAGVLPVAVIISLLSGQIVHLVFGQQYAFAGNYLAIYIWTGVPYLVFFVLNQMFYIEGLLKVGFVVSVFSVSSNVLLNFILIPMFGGMGAAISTLITAIGSTLLSLFILNLKTGIFLKRK